MRRSIVFFGLVTATVALAGLLDGGPDGYEIDDTPEVATPLALNSLQRGHSIDPPEDIDFIQFTLEASTTVLLEAADALGPFNIISGQRLCLDCPPPESIFGGENEVSVYLVTELAAGSYTAYSRKGYDPDFALASLIPSYAFHLRDATLPDRFEPNDTLEEATPLAYLGASQRHNFHSATDVDWLTFFFSGPDATVFVTLRITNSTVRPNVRLYHFEDDALVEVVPRSQGEYRLQAEGQYFAEVTNSEAFTAPEEAYYSAQIITTIGSSSPGPFPGTLAGIVASDSGQPLPDADVAITDLNGLSISTGTDGAYAFPALPSGVYTIAASKEGYHEQSATANVNTGEIDIVDFNLLETVVADVSGDGAVDAVDVQLVINAVLGIPIVFDGDVDSDGTTDAVDIQLVINAVLGV
jgi:hypothetical protein